MSPADPVMPPLSPRQSDIEHLTTQGRTRDSEAATPADPARLGWLDLAARRVKNGAQAVAGATSRVIQALNLDGSKTLVSNMTFQETPVAEDPSKALANKITFTQLGSFNIDIDGQKFSFRMRKRIGGKWEYITLSPKEVKDLEENIRCILRAHDIEPKELSNIILDFELNDKNKIDLEKNISLRVTYKKGGEKTIFEDPLADIAKNKVTADGTDISLQAQIRLISELFKTHIKDFKPESPEDGIDLPTPTTLAAQEGEGASAASKTGKATPATDADLKKYNANLCWYYAIINALKGLGINPNKTKDQIAADGPRVSRDLSRVLRRDWNIGGYNSARDALFESPEINAGIEKVRFANQPAGEAPSALPTIQSLNAEQSSLQEHVNLVLDPKFTTPPNHLILEVSSNTVLIDENTTVTLNGNHIQGTEDNTLYNLKSVLVHQSDHWTAYVLENGTWHKYNDIAPHYRTEVVPEEVNAALSQGCMFFFMKDGYVAPPEEVEVTTVEDGENGQEGAGAGPQPVTPHREADSTAAAVGAIAAGAAAGAGITAAGEEGRIAKIARRTYAFGAGLTSAAATVGIATWRWTTSWLPGK